MKWRVSWNMIVWYVIFPYWFCPYNANWIHRTKNITLPSHSSRFLRNSITMIAISGLAWPNASSTGLSTWLLILMAFIGIGAVMPSGLRSKLHTRIFPRAIGLCGTQRFQWRGRLFALGSTSRITMPNLMATIWSLKTQSTRCYLKTWSLCGTSSLAMFSSFTLTHSSKAPINSWNNCFFTVLLEYMLTCLNLSPTSHIKCTQPCSI